MISQFLLEDPKTIAVVILLRLLVMLTMAGEEIRMKTIEGSLCLDDKKVQIYASDSETGSRRYRRSAASDDHNNG